MSEQITEAELVELDLMLRVAADSGFQSVALDAEICGQLLALARRHRPCGYSRRERLDHRRTRGLSA